MRGQGPDSEGTTVERFNEGIVVSHGANIVDVNIMQKSLQTILTAPTEHRPLDAIAENSDTKLLNFFVFAKTGRILSTEDKYEILIDGQ